MTSQKPTANGASIDAAEEVSKSQRKREARDVFLLARELVEMKQSTLNNIISSVDLSEDIVFEIVKARKIKSHGARKRETQFLSKMLRHIESDSLHMAIAEPKEFAQIETRRQHRLEQWRDALIANGDQALHLLCQLNTEIDRQQCRQLIRNARREAEQNKPPASSRSLFRLLAAADKQQALPDSLDAS